MTDRSRKYLSDIVSAIELIEEFLIGINDFQIYQVDSKTRSAVERQLGIIGEAVNKVHQQGDHNLRQAQQIVQFRNRLIHAYDAVDDSIVWVIVKKHIPELKQEAIKLLKE